MPEVAFSVFVPTGRKVYYVEWTNPSNGDRVRRTTRKRVKRDADRVAQKVVDEWFRNRGREGDEAWSRFREECLGRLLLKAKPDTRRMYGIVFNAIEKYLSPAVMSDLTARAISKLQTNWRTQQHKGKPRPVSETSIRTYSIHLQKALRWAKGQGMLQDVPAIELPAKSAKAKGRPLSGEEFDRMYTAIDKVIGREPARDGWRRLLKGLYLSSLRLDEYLKLTWNDPTLMRVDLDGDFPALIIPCYTEKGKENRIIPIPKDFANLLNEVPTKQRTASVVRLVSQKKNTASPRNRDYISKKISKFGKSAGIIVGRYENGNIKFASAHDLRRSAGARWARQVRNLFDLQTLMRHKDPRTTRTYYAHEDAADLAKVVSGFADTFAITPSETAPPSVAKKPQKQG